VPEIIEDGVTGFVVEEVEAAARAVERLADFDRRRCREVFERRFTAGRMARDYVNIYERLLEIGPAVKFRVAESFLNQVSRPS
jgi:glycosyltransferase involved in cell wall biosynthesis